MADGKAERELGEVRKEIDQLDSQLVSLLEQRVRLATEIGRLKGAEDRPFFAPERERQIFERLSSHSGDVLKPGQLVAIFREVISAARAAEKPMNVAYWGPEGTFSHQAAIQVFGRSAVHEPVPNIREVFMAVERGRADYGVVPIENSTAGVIPETLDMFGKSNVKICSEAFVSVEHCLGTNAASLADIENVYAGPQPAAQCTQWLADHLPHAKLVDAAPTSVAATMASGDPKGAAIVNEACLDLYSLGCLAKQINDHADNKTRFVVLGHNKPGISGNDKTSLMFKVRNRQGELYRVLGCFVEHDVNLTMIESRPDPRSTSQFTFFMDCEGHLSETNVQRAVNDLRSIAIDLVVLGSYPSYDERLHSL